MAFTESDRKKVWDKAEKIPNKDPSQYRRDPYGNTLHYDRYGKEGKTGWEIDHIWPKSRGGSSSVRNLQAMQTAKNRELGDTLVKRSRHSKR